MMTEDLILGHFDGTLTSEQEAQLQAELSASPEVRSLYEQHRSLDSMLSADAATLAPSARLDEAVVAAALGAVPEIIGGSAVSWFTGKVAIGISAALVGGLSLAILAGSGSEKTSVPADVPDPLVRTVPPAPAPPVLIEDSKSDELKVAQEQAAKEQAVVKPATKNAKSPTPPNRRTERAKEQTPKTSTQPKMRLNKDGSTTIIDHRDPKVQPDGK